MTRQTYAPTRSGPRGVRALSTHFPGYTVRLAGPADLQALVGLGMADHEYHRLVQPDLPRVELAKERERYLAVTGADRAGVVVSPPWRLSGQTPPRGPPFGAGPLVTRT